MDYALSAEQFLHGKMFDSKCSTIERGYFKEKYNDNQTD